MRYYILKNPAVWLANNIGFHFRLLPGKTNEKTFQKIQKTLFWSHVGPFSPKFGQKWIFLKKELRQFLNIPIIYHRAKNQKKLMIHSWDKYRTDRPTGRQTDWQTHNGDFIGPSIGRVSKKILRSSFLWYLWNYCFRKCFLELAIFLPKALKLGKEFSFLAIKGNIKP